MVANGFCDATAVAVWTLDWHVGDVGAYFDSAVGIVEFRHDSDHVAGVLGAQPEHRLVKSRKSSHGGSGEARDRGDQNEDPELRKNGVDLRETPESCPGGMVGEDRSSGAGVENSPC